jgi:hypothetical protein
LSEDCQGGFHPSAQTIHSNVAVFNVGPAIAHALQFATAWHKIEVSDNDMAQLSAAGLLNSLARNRHSAGLPDDAQVFEDRDKRTGNSIYYFSPGVSAVAPKELKHSSPCLQPANLAQLKQVQF